MHILVINAGSSSIKWQLFADSVLVQSEIIERWSPSDGFSSILNQIDPTIVIAAVGHRVVHGGPRLNRAVVIDDEIVAYLETTIDLAPLHQPPAIAGIKVARESFPGAVHIACFDTTFHQTLAPAAFTYALPSEWNQRWGLRRYGFHGLSHAYAYRAGAQLVEVEPSAKIVTAHLGAGQSLCAISGGASRDTTMGFTPLEGLVMATRSGDVDPGLIMWLLENTELTVAEVFDGLEHKSGLAGLSGTSGDLRDVIANMTNMDSTDAAGQASASSGVKASATLAWEVYLHRLTKLTAAMVASIGGIELLVFTGGVGEHSAAVREQLVERLSYLGLEIDSSVNELAHSDARITGARSSVEVAVITAREDLQILHEVTQVLASH